MSKKSSTKNAAKPPNTMRKFRVPQPMFVELVVFTCKSELRLQSAVANRPTNHGTTIHGSSRKSRTINMAPSAKGAPLV